MIERIARNGLVAIHDGGASEELRAVRTRVEVSVGGVYDALLRTHRRRSGDVSHRCSRVVMERIRSDMVMTAEHLHRIEERSLTCYGVILAPVTHQTVLSVHEFSSFEEVGVLVNAVIVERIGVKRLRTMLQHHIVSGMHHLLSSVIVGIVAGHGERVALLEAHVSERFHGVCLLKEVGAVAPKLGSGMREMHLSFQYLRIRNAAILVVSQLIRMDEIHTFVCLPALFLLVWRRHSREQAEAKKA